MSEQEKSKKSRAESPKPATQPAAAPGAPSKMSDEDRANAIERLKNRRLVIPEEGLKRIAEHKYVAGVYTPIDNLFNQYFWTPVCEWIPKTIAPNTITVTGLVIKILGYAVLAMHCADFRSSAPKWAYGFAAFTIFVYQTLDALDGKQARRTGSSSPLGQLFDHGCDSVVTIFLSMTTSMSLHLGFSVRCISFHMCMLAPFWLCQWTEYHAHVLPTSIAGVMGVTEAQFICCFFALANVYDTGFWEQPLGLGTLPSWWCGNSTCAIAPNDIAVAVQMFGAAASVFFCALAVLPAAKAKGTIRLAILQLLPVYMLALVGWAWCIMIPQAHPRLVLFTLGVQFSHMTCKMIVAAMSQTEYRLFQPSLLPLPIIFVISWLELAPRHDDVLLGAYTAVSVYSMSKWVKSAIEEISQYIGIHTFRLGPRAKPKNS